MKKTILIIPARLNSSRLKEKVLIEIKGKTMLQRVYERASFSKIKEIYIATDSQKIYQAAKKFTDKVIMTATTHISGTDRIAEAASKIEFDYMINVQGDEPLIDPKIINKLEQKLKSDKIKMVTAAYLLKDKKEILDPNNVKVVLNSNSEALYFSRQPIPYNQELNAKYYCHIGIYGYTKKFLLEFVNLKNSYLEKMEKLEQLRALEFGHSISVIITDKNHGGIDNKQDLKKISKFID